MNLSRNILFNKEFDSIVKIIGLFIGAMSFLIFKSDLINYYTPISLLICIFYLLILKIYNFKKIFNNNIYFLNNKVSSIFIIYIAFIRYATGSGFYKYIPYEPILFEEEYNILKYLYEMSGCIVSCILIGVFIMACLNDLIKEYNSIDKIFLVMFILLYILILFINKNKNFNNFNQNSLRKETINNYNIIEDKISEAILTFENQKDLVRFEIRNIYINFKSGILYFINNINNETIELNYLDVKNYQILKGNKPLSEINLDDIKVIQMIAI